MRRIIEKKKLISASYVSNKNRCGIFHARGPVPPNQLTRKNIDEFVERFKERINPMLNYKAQLTEDEMKKMGEFLYLNY